MRQSQSRSFAETNKIKLLEVWEWFIIENKSGKLKNNWLSTKQYALENKKTEKLLWHFQIKDKLSETFEL